MRAAGRPARCAGDQGIQADAAGTIEVYDYNGGALGDMLGMLTGSSDLEVSQDIDLDLVQIFIDAKIFKQEE